MKRIKVKQLVKDLDLEVVHESKDDDFTIATSEVNRPGLQLAGYYEHFAYERVQIIGKVEWSFFMKLPKEEKRIRSEALMKYDIPCLVFTRDMEVSKEFLDAAKKYNKPIFRTSLASTRFISRLINYLEDKLAPTTTLHGVLVDVNGVGILIFGESGIGKSETALELIKRGYRLVSDDAVEVKKIDDKTLVGTAPELIKYYLEIRGIGILDIARLYGMGAVRDSKIIELVVQLDEWNTKDSYDRLGIDEEYTSILGVKVSKLVIPVRPGRNLAMILEAAARNHIQKKMGYNAALELEKKILKNNLEGI